MFLPSHKGTLYTGANFDGRGKKVSSDPVRIRYTPIRTKTESEPTSIRTDKSASQGRAAEEIYDGRILMSRHVEPKFGHKVKLSDGQMFNIEVVQRIYESSGQLDHYQVDLML